MLFSLVGVLVGYILVLICMGSSWWWWMAMSSLCTVLGVAILPNPFGLYHRRDEDTVLVIGWCVHFVHLFVGGKLC